MSEDDDFDIDLNYAKLEKTEMIVCALCETITDKKEGISSNVCDECRGKFESIVALVEVNEYMNPFAKKKVPRIKHEAKAVEEVVKSNVEDVTIVKIPEEAEQFHFPKDVPDDNKIDDNDDDFEWPLPEDFYPPYFELPFDMTGNEEDEDENNDSGVNSTSIENSVEFEGFSSQTSKKKNKKGRKNAENGRRRPKESPLIFEDEGKYSDQNRKKLSDLVPTVRRVMTCTISNCPRCDIIIPSNCFLENHLKICKGFYCSQCNLSFTNSKNLLTHLKCHGIEDDLWKCCDEEFTSFYFLKKHFTTHNVSKKSDIRVYICMHCRRIFFYKLKLLEHKKEVIAEKISDFKWLEINGEANIIDNIKTVFYCIKCSKQFSNDEYIDHENGTHALDCALDEIHAGPLAVIEKQETIDYKIVAKNLGKIPKLESLNKSFIYFYCSLCGFASKTTSNVNGHLKLWHDINESVSAKYTVVTCKIGSSLSKYDSTKEDFLERWVVDLAEKKKRPQVFLHDVLYKNKVDKFSLSCIRIDGFGLRSKFYCGMCNEVVRGDKRAHFQMHKSTQSCRYCSMEINKDEYISHFKTYHQNDVTCETCGKKLSSLHKLEYHKLRFHPDSSDKELCEICGEIYKKLAKQLHYVKHSNLCPVCNEQFKNLNSLFKHVKMSHKDVGTPQEILKDYKFCSKCKKCLRNENTLLNHQASCFKKQFSCQYCSKSFSDENKHKMHMKVHSEESTDKNRYFECEICKTVVCRGFMVTHMRIQHNIQDLYRCSLCFLRFNTKRTAINHVKCHPDHSRDFRCPVCNIKTYHRNWELKSHMKAYHNWPEEFYKEAMKNKFYLSDYGLEWRYHFKTDKAPRLDFRDLELDKGKNVIWLDAKGEPTEPPVVETHDTFEVDVSEMAGILEAKKIEAASRKNVDETANVINFEVGEDSYLINEEGQQEAVSVLLTLNRRQDGQYLYQEYENIEYEQEEEEAEQIEDSDDDVKYQLEMEYEDDSDSENELTPQAFVQKLQSSSRVPNLYYRDHQKMNKPIKITVDQRYFASTSSGTSTTYIQRGVKRKF